MSLYKYKSESVIELKDFNEATETIENTSNSVLNTNRSNLSAFKKLKNYVTVEPLMLISVLANTLPLNFLLQLKYEMACRNNMHLNEEICATISAGAEYVTGVLGYYEQWFKPIGIGLTAIFTLTYGAFSDKYKVRKAFLILPRISDIITSAGLFFCVYFISVWPVQVFYTFVFIIPAFTGGDSTLIVTLFSYISDVTTEEERTTRIGYMELISVIITPIITITNGILFDNLGFYGIICTCLTLHVIGFIYTILFIKDKESLITKKKSICLEVFNIKSVLIHTLKILFSDRSGNKKKLLILTYVLYIIMKGPGDGLELYFTYYPIQEFRWQNDMLFYYRGLESLVHVIGMLFVTIVFTKIFHWNDIIIALIACVFKIIVGIWYTLSSSSIMYFMGPIFSTFTGIYVIALRSLVTKLVDNSEFAQSQALFAIFDIVCQALYNWVFYNFYIKTKTTFRPAFFTLFSVLYIPALLILLIMLLMYNEDRKINQKIPGTSTENICEIPRERID